jgi:hypothetical protein
VCVDAASGKLVAGCDGAVGPAGPTGPAGSPCTVADDGMGTAPVACPGGSSVSYAIPYCGNSIVEAGEECDMGSDTAHCVQCEKFLFPGSAIISKAQGVRINDWLGLPYQKWTRCYQKSVNGNSTTTFHTNCDDRGPTIMVALLNGGSGIERVIGGYASSSWNVPVAGYSGSSDNFLFSLTNNFKHNPIVVDTFQYNHGSYGPTFGGGHDFYTNLSSSSYCNIGHSYACRVGTYGSATCRNDFCGQYNPVIYELEVWYRTP